MENFWVILLVAIVITMFVTKSWYERMLMVVYYALGLLFAVHVSSWGWKLLFMFVVISFCMADKDREMMTPSHVVGYTIVLAMVLHTVTNWLGFGAGLAGIITTVFSIATIVAAIKNNSVKA